MVECVADEGTRRKRKRGSSKRLKRNRSTVRRKRMIVVIKLIWSEEKKVKKNVLSIGPYEQVEPISVSLLVVCESSVQTAVAVK